MAILSGKRARNGPSSGNDFDRIKEPIFGHGKSMLNKKKDLFNSDYIYVYKSEDDEDIIHDGEVGINKNYHRIHDSDWCNNEKNEHHALNRFFDGLDHEDDDIEYGDIDLDDIEEFL